LLTETSGKSWDYTVNEAPDDSYHAAWFMAAAADYERALNEGPNGEFARVNLDEAATALALSIAARQSAAQNGSAVSLNAAE
jgi:hypothetical protein